MRIKIPLKYTLPIIQLCQNKTNLENLSEAVTFENTGQCFSRNSLIKYPWKGTQYKLQLFVILTVHLGKKRAQRVLHVHAW